MTAEIHIGRGLVVAVDDDDYLAMSALKWRVGGTKKHPYAVRTAAGHMASGCEYMHRALLGNPSGVVDHIDGNTMNNTRANLRVVTHEENNRNNHVIRSASGYRGVFAQGAGFIARVHHEKTVHYVGSFADPMEAALHVNRMLDQLRPGIGARNKIDHDYLLSVLEARKAEIQKEIDLVRSEGGK